MKTGGAGTGALVPRAVLALVVLLAAGCGGRGEPEYETGADARPVADAFARTLPDRPDDHVGRAAVRRLRETRRAQALELVGEPVVRERCRLPGADAGEEPCFEYYLVGRPAPTVLHERVLQIWVAREDGRLDVHAVAARGSTTRCEPGFRPDSDPPPEERNTLTAEDEVVCRKPAP